MNTQGSNTKPHDVIRRVTWQICQGSRCRTNFNASSKDLSTCSHTKVDASPIHLFSDRFLTHLKQHLMLMFVQWEKRTQKWLNTAVWTSSRHSTVTYYIICTKRFIDKRQKARLGLKSFISIFKLVRSWLMTLLSISVTLRQVWVEIHHWLPRLICDGL